jgi:predicted MPP superfamily phosphohydrolase
MAGLYALQLRAWLTISEAEVEIAGLRQGLDGTRILLVTDLHAGPFLNRSALRPVFARLRRLRPELILLGGDLATALPSDLQPHRSALRRLRAPLGSFAVLGNHDHYTGDPDGIRSLLQDCGIRVLHNEAVTVVRGGTPIGLCGIDDLHSGRPDLDRAVRNLPERTTAILLSHNPDIFFEAARRGVDLVLSGHTHGGQIRIPGLPVLVRMSRYRLDHGRFESDGAQLVVSRGLGATGLPLRIACAPEAVLITLRRTPPAPGGPPVRPESR